MYTYYKSIQLLIACLKVYNVKHVVLSPGGSDIPLIHSIETDDFFTCYSVIDERSAVYFGIGVSQIHNEPVACICTSGTAVSNYLPGITEAFYQNVPIIAITADKNPYFQGQIETQKIEQHHIFGEVCRKAVTLNLNHDENDDWYNERLIKEAILTAIHGSKGPVQINIPVVGSYNQYNVEKLPSIRKVEIVKPEDEDSIWLRYAEKISHARKVLIVVGQNVFFSDRDVKNIESFYERYNCVISVEHLSNLESPICLHTYPLTETGNLTEELVPDLVISLGNNLSAYSLKPFLRRHDTFEHFSIDEDGRYRDVYKGLSCIFECSASFFFEKMVSENMPLTKNNKQYDSAWRLILEKIQIPEFPFSSIYVAGELSKIIPERSILHLAILNSTRVMQFFKLRSGIKVFSNVGALGIDGCLSTFMGQATQKDNLAFCLIGDLSFFYDMNAAGIRHLGNNVRIVLLNNRGGAEFHFFMDKDIIPTLNDYICAEHSKSAEGWVKSLGFEYSYARNKQELQSALESFATKSSSPKFLEVFTDMEEDAQILKKFYGENHPDSFILKFRRFAGKIKRKLL